MNLKPGGGDPGRSQVVSTASSKTHMKPKGKKTKKKPLTGVQALLEMDKKKVVLVKHRSIKDVVRGATPCRSVFDDEPDLLK